MLWTEIPQWLAVGVAFVVGALASRLITRAARRVGHAVASAGRHTLRVLRFATVPAGGTLTERHHDGSTWTVDRSPRPKRRKRGRERRRG